MSDNKPKGKYPQGTTVPDMASEVNLFVQHIDSLVASLPGVMFTIVHAEQDADDRFRRYADKYGKVIEHTDNRIGYTFGHPYDARATLLSNKIRQAAVANDIIPKVFVLALVSQFDAFLGRLLRVLFLLRPELITSSERTLTLSQLLELGTIESATEYLLEKEIESVLRKSHVEQFSWMENKFSMKLRIGLDSWPVFVELTERRNLFAHANGIVSDQYIAVCKSNGVDLPDDCSRGKELVVTPEYFQCAYACVYEIGVKLSQVLWRKLKPDQLEEADDNLTEVTFDLLVAGKFKLACRLLDFACTTLKKHGSEQSRLMMTINRAQAYKWAGDSKKCRSILDEEDWSACGPQFHLAVAVLEDAHEKAAELMRSIGPNGVMKETQYQDWPLFREFRKTDAFALAYKEVFGRSFVHIEKILKADEKERRRTVLEKLRQALEQEAELPDTGLQSTPHNKCMQ